MLDLGCGRGHIGKHLDKVDRCALHSSHTHIYILPLIFKLIDSLLSTSGSCQNLGSMRHVFGNASKMRLLLFLTHTHTHSLSLSHSFFLSPLFLSFSHSLILSSSPSHSSLNLIPLSINPCFRVWQPHTFQCISCSFTPFFPGCTHPRRHLMQRLVIVMIGSNVMKRDYRFRTAPSMPS